MGGFSFAPTLIRQGLRNALMQSGQDAPEGAPADFGGAVFPNPDGIKPRLDTDPGPATQLSPGASLSSPVYRGGARMDTSNPPMNQMTPSLMQEVKASDRVEDDPASRHNVQSIVADGSLADLESRVGTTARPQYRPVAPDDHMQQLETQYRAASAPQTQPPMSLARKIGLGLITAAGGGAGVARGLQTRNARFDEQQALRQKNAQGLLGEIEAERRMQEQEQWQSQRLAEEERGQNLRAEMQREATDSQTNRLLMQMREQEDKQQREFEHSDQNQQRLFEHSDESQRNLFKQEDKLQADRDAEADKRLQNTLTHQDLTTKEKVLTYWQPALESAERVNVMSKNFQDAVNNHDQQAMLSLLSNHLGMTMGLQKGSRLNQALIAEAQKSQPWLQGLRAKFDKDGYLSGVTLSPQQMQQMVSLGFERYREDVKKSRSMAGYIGVKDEPPRQLSREAASWYAQQAGGDLNKARQMAAGDGWTF